MSVQWRAGTQPWVRREGEKRGGVGYDGDGFTTCYFCGQATAKISATDVAADTARVEMFCDSGNCDAREMTVLLHRDGMSGMLMRADVRTLEAIDSGDTQPADGSSGITTLLTDAVVSDEEVLARRTSTALVHVELPSVP